VAARRDSGEYLPDRVAGGASAYPGRNGDTAPAAKEPDGDRDRMQDWDRLVPYSRARENGCVIRVETDGYGGLLEFVESSTGDMLWGVTRGSWRKMRTTVPRRRGIASGNLVRVCRRFGMESRVLGYLNKHCQNSVGARYGVLADRVGTSRKNIENVMRRLHANGYVVPHYGLEPMPHGGSRQIVFWQLTDAWQDHLPAALVRMVESKPLSASEAAQLLGLGYERVVRTLADLAADGRLDRKRDGPGYVYMEHADLEIGGW